MQIVVRFGCLYRFNKDVQNIIFKDSGNFVLPIYGKKMVENYFIFNVKTTTTACNAFRGVTKLRREEEEEEEAKRRQVNMGVKYFD